MVNRGLANGRLVMSETETKICPLCAETIKAAAKVCPRCGRNQPVSVKEPWRRMIEAWLFLAAFAAIVFGGLFWLATIVGPGRPFESYRERVVVVDPQMHFGGSGAGNYISTIGFIRNDSPLAWKDIQLEVRYFDSQGKLADTRTEVFWDRRLPSGDQQAFRIRGPADKTSSAYASQEVAVRSAVDARSLRR